MTITLTDARAVREPVTRPERLAFKNADSQDSPSGQMLAVDETEGIVTAIVSVTGIEDEVADIIEPGAYKSTLARRRPKVCWAHAWDKPIGKVLYIEELLPGDERLPVKTRDGQPWPREAGALVATMQFNMKSEAGREAFEAVRFYSETGECEYSIGYQVPPGKSSKDKAGVRHIKALELYELSVVLFGAHTMTGTLSIKAALAAARERLPLGGHGTVHHAHTGTMTPARAALAKVTGKALGNPLVDPDADGDTGANDKDGPPDFSDGVMVAVYPDPGAADKIAAHIAGPDDTIAREDLHVTIAFLGTTGEISLSSHDIVRAVTDAVEGIPVLTGFIGGIGQFPDSGDGAPTWAPVDVPGLNLLHEVVANALSEDVHTEHGFTPHMTLGYDIGLIDPVPETPVTFSSVRVVYGTQQSDIALGAKVQAGGETKTKATGKALPLDADTDIRGTCTCGPVVFDTMNGWQRLDGSYSHDDGTTHSDHLAPPTVAQMKAAGVDTAPVATEKLREYWAHGEGAAKIRWGEPGDFDRCVTHLSKHMTPEQAKGYCAERHHDALGVWPGQEHDKDGKAMTYDPTLDKPTATKMAEPIGSKRFPYLTGSYEERLAAIRAAVEEALHGELISEENNRYEWDYVSIDATWDERVIATRTKWGSGVDETETYEMPYTFDATEGTVELGDPQPLTLTVVAIAEDNTETEDYSLAEAMPLASSIAAITHIIKSSKPTTIEGKAGRVLSGRNERQLRDAVERLLDVLSAAGVPIATTDDQRRLAEADLDLDADARREMDPGVDLETTSTTAQVGASKTLSLDDVNGDLAALGLPVLGA